MYSWCLGDHFSHATPMSIHRMIQYEYTLFWFGIAHVHLLLLVLCYTYVESASSAPGQQLCATLFSADALSASLALSALAHALLANVEQRTELLRVQLGTGSSAT